MMLFTSPARDFLSETNVTDDNTSNITSSGNDNNNISTITTHQHNGDGDPIGEFKTNTAKQINGGDTNCNNIASLMRRTEEELTNHVKSDNFDLNSLTNEEILKLMRWKHISVRRLESILGKTNAKRCVEIRRQYYCELMKLLDDLDLNQDEEVDSNKAEDCETQQQSSATIRSLRRADVLIRPQNIDFDYSQVVGACCENVFAYVRLPVGLVGPLKMDGEEYYVPMATTEGCLVASTSRGLSALYKSGEVRSKIIKNAMTRAPIVRFQDADFMEALNQRDKAVDWLQRPETREKIKKAFESNSRHTKLIDYTLHEHGRDLHIRFEAQTGDAMGMNMCSKGSEAALKEMKRLFPTMDILTLSGNMCTDKKPAAINWIKGRGKSVECNATLTAEVVEKILKVSVDSLFDVWLKKVMIGGAKAGTIGGFNCHAANVVAAIFIATGQDAAQVVSSSNCIITLEKDLRGSLSVTCEMPSIECGTVGGGTFLQDQSSFLQLMGIRGSSKTTTSSLDDTKLPTEEQARQLLLDSDSNACKLAKIICSTVMAAELSLLASLTKGTLVESHITHNRSAQPCNVN